MSTVTRNKRKSKAPAFVRATTTMTGTIDGQPVVIRRGEQYRDDHPATAVWPERFVPHDAVLPPDELPERPTQAEPVDVVVNTNPAVRAVMLRRDLRVHIHGGPILELRAGQLIDGRHELVQQHPRWFHRTEETS